MGIPGCWIDSYDICPDIRVPRIPESTFTCQHPGRIIPSYISLKLIADTCQETIPSQKETLQCFSVSGAMFLFLEISWKQTTSLRRYNWIQNDIIIVDPFVFAKRCLQYIRSFRQTAQQKNALRQSNNHAGRVFSTLRKPVKPAKFEPFPRYLVSRYSTGKTKI